jgi:hypothetical protein
MDGINGINGINGISKKQSWQHQQYCPADILESETPSCAPYLVDPVARAMLAAPTWWRG